MPASIVFGLPGRETLFPSASFTYVPFITPTGDAAALPTPLPIQAGMASNCNGWHQAVLGDSCSNIAQANGISLDTFVQWNQCSQ
jgi:hypothetical protein